MLFYALKGIAKSNTNLFVIAIRARKSNNFCYFYSWKSNKFNYPLFECLIVLNQDKIKLIQVNKTIFSTPVLRNNYGVIKLWIFFSIENYSREWYSYDLTKTSLRVYGHHILIPDINFVSGPPLNPFFLHISCYNKDILYIQSTKILLLSPKYEIIMLPSNHSFFQYYDSNIGLFSIAPWKVITLNPLCILFGISSLLLFRWLSF